MRSIEDIGEAIIRLANRAFYYGIGALIWLIKALRPVNERLRKNIGLKISGYLEKRGIEPRDYTVLKTQISTLVFLMSAVLFVFGLLDIRSLVILLVAFGSCSLYLVLVQLKKYFSDDYPAYRAFFLSFLAISLMLVIVKFIKPTVDVIFPSFHFLLLAVFSVVAVSLFFKRKYGRNYTFGRVIEDGDNISVKVNYDIRSSIKPGVHTFQNTINANVGDVVKLLVESDRFNIRGSRIVGPVADGQERSSS